MIPLGLTAAASARDAAIQKKIFGSGRTVLIIFNDEMNYIMKIVKSQEELDLQIKSVKGAIKMKKKKKVDFLVLLSTLGPVLLGNMLAGKGAVRDGDGFIQESYGVITAG